MSDNKHERRGLAGKGYYIALILCAAAIGISGYLYQKTATKPEEVSVQETFAEDIPAGTLEQKDVPALATEPKGQSQVRPQPTAPSTVETTPAPTEKKVLKTASPLAGETIVGYSMEALSYNQTTRDWRVHNGVDIAAEAGTPVCAAAEGRVTAVFEDDALGYTVVITHDGGYTTQYSSLAEDLSVKVGDTVTLGQVIGCVGETALVETTLGSHVHFSVTYRDKIMDPAEFLNLGK